MSEHGDGLTFAKLAEANRLRLHLSYPECLNWSALEWGAALCGEAGELANLLKKQRDGLGRDVPKGRLADELADVVIYADLLASVLGVDLGVAVKHKFNRTSVKIESGVIL